MLTNGPEERVPPRQRVRSLSQHYGSAAKLAERIGVTRHTVMRWESGDPVSERNAAKLAALEPAVAAGLKPVDFLTLPGTEAIEKAAAGLEQSIQEGMALLEALRAAGKA